MVFVSGIVAISFFIMTVVLLLYITDVRTSLPFCLSLSHPFSLCCFSFSQNSAVASTLSLILVFCLFMIFYVAQRVRNTFKEVEEEEEDDDENDTKFSFCCCVRLSHVFVLFGRNILFSTHPVEAHGVVWKRQEEDGESFSKFYFYCVHCCYSVLLWVNLCYSVLFCAILCCFVLFCAV